MVDKMCGRDNANVQNSNKKDGGGDCEQEQKSKFRLGMAWDRVINEIYVEKIT